MTAKARRRETLSDADVTDFIQRASDATPRVPPLEKYTWWASESVEAAEMIVYSRKGSEISITFRDIVPEADGVFFFGWDDESQNAIWKWVPATVPETKSLRWSTQKREVAF